MIRLSIQTRQGLSRLTLPLLIGLSCALMIVSRIDPPLAGALRAGVLDRLVPVLALLHRPADGLRDIASGAAALVDLSAENRRLRAENRDLRHWYDVAVSLAAENAALKANLHWLAEPVPQFVTARAVADAGGLYGRAVLLAAGSDQGLRKGEIAIDADGLAGRITDLGARSARVLLITDMTSRVPVTLDGSHAPAMLVGDDAPLPRLLYYPDDVHPEEGERVVTSSEVNAFPAGLLVGTVHYLSTGEPVVVPAARLDRLDLLRIFDFGLPALVPPAEPGRALPSGRPEHPSERKPEPRPERRSGPEQRSAPAVPPLAPGVVGTAIGRG